MKKQTTLEIEDLGTEELSEEIDQKVNKMIQESEKDIKEGYKQTELGLIPNDWEVKKGAEIAIKITKGASPKWQGFEYQKEGMLFITSENVKNGYLELKLPKFLKVNPSPSSKITSIEEPVVLTQPS